MEPSSPPANEHQHKSTYALPFTRAVRSRQLELRSTRPSAPLIDNNAPHRPPNSSASNDTRIFFPFINSFDSYRCRYVERAIDFCLGQEVTPLVTCLRLPGNSMTGFLLWGRRGDLLYNMGVVWLRTVVLELHNGLCSMRWVDFYLFTGLSVCSEQPTSDWWDYGHLLGHLCRGLFVDANPSW